MRLDLMSSTAEVLFGDNAVDPAVSTSATDASIGWPHT
jgi:hypothetical protein